MSRESDLKWFLDNREKLAQKYSGLWIVVCSGDVQKVCKNEEDAVDFSVNMFGIDVASVFLATASDPFTYVGGF